MNDEVGSAVVHSSEPNCVMLPFIFSRGNAGTIPYSVLFPIKNIAQGEIITRDFVPKDLEEKLQRQAYLTAFPGRIVDEEEIGSEDKFIDAYEVSFTSIVRRPSREGFSNFLFFLPFTKKSTQATSKPVTCAKPINAEAILKMPTTQNVDIKVYTTADFVKQNLTLPHIVFTNDLESADIIWVVQDFSDWDKLKPNQRISQVPNESCMTYKNNLAQLLS